MKAYFKIILGLVLCFNAGCDTVSIESDKPLVIEAYLFAGEPIDDIIIKQAIPFESGDTSSVPVVGATVILTKEGIDYQLSPSNKEGSYYYAGDELRVEEGDAFSLRVEYEGAIITASTRVPGQPREVALSSTEMPVPDFEAAFSSGGGNFDSLQELLTVTWDNTSEDYYYVVVSSEEPAEPDYILPDFVRDFIGDFELISEPTTSNYHEILPVTLSWLGPHYVTVYQVNQEYADLFENREQDSRDLTEPPTNIEGGVGIFTAFNSVVGEFEVVRE